MAAKTTLCTQKSQLHAFGYAPDSRQERFVTKNHPENKIAPLAGMS